MSRPWHLFVGVCALSNPWMRRCRLNVEASARVFDRQTEAYVDGYEFAAAHVVAPRRPEGWRVVFEPVEVESESMHRQPSTYGRCSDDTRGRAVQSRNPVRRAVAATVIHVARWRTYLEGRRSMNVYQKPDFTSPG